MNNWNILIENTDDGFTVATVLEAPSLQTKDRTKQGAVAKVRELLQQRLSNAEIISIPVDIKSLSEQNSLMKFAGIFEGDSDFQDIVKDINAEREDKEI